ATFKIPRIRRPNTGTRREDLTSRHGLIRSRTRRSPGTISGSIRKRQRRTIALLTRALPATRSRRRLAALTYPRLIPGKVCLATNWPQQTLPRKFGRPWARARNFRDTAFWGCWAEAEWGWFTGRTTSHSIGSWR